MTHRLIKLVLVTALSVLPGVALAEDDAERFVREKQSQLVEQAKKSDGKTEAIFDEILDYDVLAQESLGKHWAGLSDAQKTQFKCVLRELVMGSYRRSIKKTLTYQVTFNGVDRLEKGTLVKTVAKNAKNPREDPVSISYLLHQSGGRLRIRDIVTEGTSMVGNYRSQFQRIIEKKGFDELMRRMTDKAGSAGQKC